MQNSSFVPFYPSHHPFRLSSASSQLERSFFLIALIEPSLDFNDTFGYPFDDPAIAFPLFLREPNELPGSLVESVIYGPFLSIPPFAKTYCNPRQPFPHSLKVPSAEVFIRM